MDPHLAPPLGKGFTNKFTKSTAFFSLKSVYYSASSLFVFCFRCSGSANYVPANPLRNKREGGEEE